MNCLTCKNKSLFLYVIYFVLLFFGFFTSIKAQTATQLQILLPGMSAAPGTPTGYTGEPYTQTTGVPFQVIVNAVDDNYNIVSLNDNVSLTSSDRFASLPPATALVNGTVTLTITLNSIGLQTITADDITNPNILDAVSPGVDVVEVMYFTFTDIGEPYHIYPGEVTVGDYIQQVEIIARDAQGNRVNSYTKYVTLSQHTDYGTGRIEPETIRLEAGKWKGDLQIFRAGKKVRGPGVTGDVWVRVNDSNIFGESNRFVALPRAYSKIITIVPGQEHVPGSITGKSGIALDQQANGQFNIDIYTTDQYWNQVSTVNTSINFTSTDGAAILPGTTPLSGGHLVAPITLMTNGIQTVTASDATNPSISPGISSPIKVISFQLHHFEFSNISSPKTAGSAFNVTITAVDALGNLINDFDGKVDLSSSTGAQTLTPTEVTMNNGVWTGQITITKASSIVTISAVDRTNPPHTGTSNQFEVRPGVLSKLQVLLPGETATPGVAPGKSGSVESILAGTSLQVRVNAIDNWWNVISTVSHTVHISSTDPSANLPSDAALYNGTRQFVLTLNSTGVHTISAHDVTQPSVTPGTSSQILVNPGNLYQFSFNNIIGPVTAGIPFTVTITAEDQYGNQLESYSGSLSLLASTGAGTISPINIIMNQGQYIGNVYLTKATDGVFISVTDGANPPHTGNSNQFKVIAGALAKLQVLVPGITATPGLAPGYTGSPNDQKSGQPFSIQVKGVDAHWNVVPTATDSFGISSTDLSASLPENTVLINGSRSLSVTLNSGGQHSISAYHLNNPSIANGQSPYINVIPQNLDHFAFSQIQSPVVAGEPFEITIRAETNLNEVVGNFTGQVHLEVTTGANTILPQQIGPFVNGEWTGELTVTKVGSNVSITASDDADPPHTGTSNMFSVVPGPFQKLQVLLPGEEPLPGVSPGKTGTPLDQFTGTQFDLRVRAVDNYWNLITQVTDSIYLTSTDELALIPEKSKLLNGVAVLSVIMGSAGVHTITASDITNTNITGDVSSSFLVNPGTLDRFIFQTIAVQTAGLDFNVEIFAADAAGYPISGFNGHARLTASTGEGTLTPTQIQFVDGYWNGKLTITKAMTNVKLTCLDFAAQPHTGESNLFDVNAGPFTRLQILLPGELSTPGLSPGKQGTVETQIVGDALAVTVNAVDNWWNPVISASALVGLTSTDQNANLPMDATLSAGSVTFSSLRFMTPGYWTITAHCKSDPDISSDTSPTVHVITGSVANFMFDPITSPQFVGDTLQLSVRAVDGSGTIVSSYSELASMTVSTGPGTIIIGEIRFEAGLWSGPVILTKASQSIHLNIHDFEDVVRGNSNPFTLLPGPLARLQILLPGETATPGLSTAKTGYPSPQTLGVPFEVTVNATDVWYNKVIPESLTLHFSSTDQSAVLPSDTIQEVSTIKYNVTLLTVGKNKISVQTVDAPFLKDTSSTFTVLTGQVDHFVFSNIDNAQYAGNSFSVRIEARNQFDNPVTDYEGDIILSASTGNGTLSATGVTIEKGFWEGELAVTRADSDVVLYAADYIPAPNTHTGYSNQFIVLPADLTGLQILLPGETTTPGVEPGKKGKSVSQIAGQSFPMIIRAVDAFHNLVPGQLDTLEFVMSDTFAFLPDTLALINGHIEIPVILRAAGVHQVGVRMKNNPIISFAYSDSITVLPSDFTQLLVLLPGEELLPGDTENDPLKTPGRQNLPTAQTSGLPFDVSVLAVDDYWNLVESSSNDEIRLYTTDNTAKVVPTSINLIEGRSGFSVTLNQGGNQIIRAIDESNSNIRTSLDALVEVLIGGLHYEIVLDTNVVAAGDPFEMEIFYKNGNNEVVISANHLVQLSLVNASDLSEVPGSLEYVSLNLANGYRKINQSCTAVGRVRIKVEDQIDTAPAYSEPLEILAGSVETIEIESAKNEVRALEKLTVTTLLMDATGNPVPEKDVEFMVVTGTGTLENSSATSNDQGIATVVFSAGRVTETNTIRAKVDSIYTDYDIIVNLTPSSLPDGVPLNYPNPFGGESDVTHIDYYLSDDADVTLQIYDLFGNLVWTKQISAGAPGGMARERSNHPNSVIWDGVNDKGKKVGSGGYILIAKAVANGRTIMDAHRKIAVIR